MLLATAVAAVSCVVDAPAGLQTLSDTTATDTSSLTVVTAVRVTPTAVTHTALGGVQGFSAVALNASGDTISGISPIWSSSDPAIVAIDTATGVATATSNGTATVRATVYGVIGSATMHVRQQGTRLALVTQPRGASAGESLAVQPVVELRDSTDNLVMLDSTTLVTASIASGADTLAGMTAATVSGGVVAFSDLAVHGVVGKRVLSFEAPDLTPIASDTIQITAAAAAVFSPNAGDGQAALAATGLSDSLAAILTDRFGNPIVNSPVVWAVTAGSGSIAPVTGLTDDSGVASTSYAPGRHPGLDSIVALAAALPGSTATFTVTVTPNATVMGMVSASDAPLAPPAAPITPVQGPTTGPGLGAAVPDELIVTFRSQRLGAPPVGSMGLMALPTAESVRSTIESRVTQRTSLSNSSLRGISPAIMAARIRVADLEQLDAIAAEWRRDPDVLSVEPNYRVYTQDMPATVPLGDPAAPTDPLYPWQAWHYSMIDLPEAWNLTTGSASVLVALVDDGIRFDHPDIAANLTSDGYDFVTNLAFWWCGGGMLGNAGDGDGYDPDPTNPMHVTVDPILNCAVAPNESGNHGLHVAGTIGAATHNGIAGAGINWSVKIRPVRVLGAIGGSHYDVAQGILYAAGLPADDGRGGTVQAPTGARIINLSLGGPTTSDVLENAVTAAYNTGALIVAAAGNGASSDPFYPAAYQEVVSVAALGPDGMPATYSSYGSTVDIAAPGGDLNDGDESFGVTSLTWNYVTGQPTTDSWHGTSMAAPHVSGTAALLLASEPGLTVAQLRARLLDYAVDAGQVGRDDFYGAGIVNAWNSLSQTIGHSGELHARLIDATTGGIVETVTAEPDGSYQFNEIDDGDYFVFAGEDVDGDAVIGIPGRRWGALGGSAMPDVLRVFGADVYPASFPVGIPSEQEPNGTNSTANYLPVGGYLVGTISNVSIDVDVMRIEIPVTALYTFETSAKDGACGFALAEDTGLELSDADGVLVASNDDVDPQVLNYCSRISMVLDPGSYFLQVLGTKGLDYVVSLEMDSP